ncbi:MAG: MFS transporter [Gammaproteobacteria bacterium]|nr:MFS transporter [Gammaproteobacteria bacterium]NIV49675.1 MFS transporter [Gammaproteobacteria bacterium]NIW57073.1 MFS transporter [Gammaproteobacteria bacterium]
MSSQISRSTVVFSCLGHLYIHLCTAFFFVIVLSLESVWQLPYHELIELWTLGSLMVGVVALPAGMLADRIGSARMMVAYFLGMGGCAIAAGLVQTPTALLWCLTGIGVFAAIYHPVGIPWLVRNAGSRRGKALGFNGIFGSLGTALAGVVAGALIDTSGWRAAFIVPGAVSVLTGIALLAFMARGAIDDRVVPSGEEESVSRSDMWRVFAILVTTMFLLALVYQSIQTSLPKLMELRHQGLAGEGVLGIGLLVAAVYTAAAFMQIIGGHLADRYPLKPVYVGALLIQVPTLWLAASLGGVPLLIVAIIMVMAGVGALPAENMLLARYAPQSRHGLVFGVKFVLAFGAAPLAVQLVALVTERTGEFYWLYALLAAFALVAMCAALMLPSEQRIPAVRPAGAD